MFTVAENHYSIIILRFYLKTSRNRMAGRFSKSDTTQFSQDYLALPNSLQELCRIRNTIYNHSIMRLMKQALKPTVRAMRQ